MNFRTTFDVPAANIRLNYGNSVVLLGSCFSDRIGAKLKYFGFDALVNPFGTLFHPQAIAKLLTIQQNAEIRIGNKEKTWFTFEGHSQLNGNSSSEVTTNFKKATDLLSSYLSKSKLLIITLGSAWGYYLDDEIVANCHKMPSNIFEKKLSPLDEMQLVWRQTLVQLHQKYPQLEIMFTISPVRHTKDGIVENQQSKSRLIELTHSLNVTYFPSYEIVMDDLRDYRFYEADMIHPNTIAVDYIFDIFTKYKISQESSRFFQQIHKFRQFEAHQIRPFDREKYEEHQQEIERKRGLLRCQILGIDL